MVIKEMSPRLSWKGYSFKQALFRNKNEVKAVLAIIVGANYLTGFDWKTFGLSVAAGVIALVSKLVWDAFDYYFTEVEL